MYIKQSRLRLLSTWKANCNREADLLLLLKEGHNFLQALYLEVESESGICENCTTSRPRYQKTDSCISRCWSHSELPCPWNLLRSCKLIMQVFVWKDQTPTKNNIEINLFNEVSSLKYPCLFSTNIQWIHFLDVQLKKRRVHFPGHEHNDLSMVCPSLLCLFWLRVWISFFCCC